MLALVCGKDRVCRRDRSASMKAPRMNARFVIPPKAPTRTLPLAAPLEMPAIGGGAVHRACLPDELPQVLDHFAGIRVLSLDCFDTLLWRDCHAPTDLFATLPAINPYQRVHGETRARRIARAGRGAEDVAIEEIYRAIMPQAREADRARAIAAELAAEARHCYGFAPTIALMREARRRKMQVIVVSDTYLNPRQLHDLIARAAGSEVAGLIDRVFCSSTFGKPKAAGLYGAVLPRLKVAPHEILHIGDNAGADVDGVAPFGVNTVHLVQFSAGTRQQLRLESAAAALIGGADRQRLLAPQPHRAALALQGPRLPDKAQQFGFATMGPVLFGFDRWLHDEARRLKAERGGTVHWLFLMRDGYLPMRVHEAMRKHVGQPDDGARAIEISRLTATFSSFAQDTAILRHIEESRGTDPAVIAAQLRLPEETIATLCDGREPGEAWRALYAWCRLPANRRPIVKAAQDHAARLVAHVRAAVAPAPGDTLMLIDLGYNGSVQSLIDPMLRRALGVHVAGRYLILREVQQSGCDKRGYLGDDRFDPALLNAMTANVALIEQLCTAAQGSVIDYDAQGQALRGTNVIQTHQSAVREAVQEGCMGFAAAAITPIVRADADHAGRAETIDLWRAANAATLLRLMFLPQRDELAVVSAFEHDVNLGTGETLALFDPAIARAGLLQQGLFYQKGARRMFLPAELGEEGFATRMTHLAMARFPMPLTSADFADDAGQIAVILSDATESTRIALPYRPTHDGFYALCIPVGASRFVAAVPFGTLAPYIEVQAITAMPAGEYLDGQHDSQDRLSAVVPQFEAITPLTPKLWHCPDPSGFVLMQAPPAADAGNRVIVVVFRPVGCA